MFFFFAGPSSIHMAGLDPAGLTGSLAQANDPGGKTKGTRELPHACMLSNIFKYYCSSEL